MEIKGIYQIKNNSDNALNPTAKKVENLLFSDSQLLINLKEQTQGIYEGEISFFIADPLHLDKMVTEIKDIASIDWNRQYERLQVFQNCRTATKYAKSRYSIDYNYFDIRTCGTHADTDIEDSWKNTGSWYSSCDRNNKTADYRAISIGSNDFTVAWIFAFNYYLSSTCGYI